MMRHVFTRALTLAALFMSYYGANAQSDLTNLSTGVISAQYYDSPNGEDINKVIDNQSNTKYLTFHPSGWIQFKVPSVYKSNKYSITSANDFEESDPKNWTFAGSNDGVSWTTLDTRTNQDFPSRFQRREFTFTNNTGYLYYRLTMSNNYSDILQLAEWEVFGTPVLTDITELGGLFTTNQIDSMAWEGLPNLIDNFTITKYLTLHGDVSVQLQQANLSVVSKYSITSANDSPDRDPVSWTLQGSANGTNWVQLDSRSNETFSNRFQRKEYTFSNSNSYSYYRLNLNNGGGMLQLSEIEIFGLGGGGNVATTPPAIYDEFWFEHRQAMTRKFYNDDVVIYFDSDMNQSLTWMDTCVTKAWRYSKQVYGDLSAGWNDKRVWAFFHKDKYSGGHPGYWFHGKHGYKNAIDMGQDGDWATPSGWSLDATMHEMGHVVESTNNGAQGSPAFGVWRDSRWCDIYMYDLYTALGWASAAQSFYNEQMAKIDDYPKANTHWFEDWYYPVWNTHGKATYLSNFFKLLAQYFPKEGKKYTRDMNWGEYIHFCSGAAGVNLKSQATYAFGWPAEWETQFNQAKIDFPQITYSNSLRTDNSTNSGANISAVEEFSGWSDETGSVLTLNVPVENASTGDLALYSTEGALALKRSVALGNNVGRTDITKLSPGLYIMVMEANGKVYKNKVVIKK